jgi:enoyl-CoA hydratase/carnithine racemase
MPLVIYEKFDRYAVFTLNRPEARNALNEPLRAEFVAAMADFNKDPSMRVGIVTGNGSAFCAGGDLKEMASHYTNPDDDWEPIQTLGLFSAARGPFIAAVNGPAVAGGFEWTLDCDIRIACPEAYFGQYEIKRGISPAFGIHHLSRYIPFGEAMVMLLTGRDLSAERAHHFGFVHEVVPRDQLLPRAIELAREIASMPESAVTATRALARQYLEMGKNPGMVEWVRRYAHASPNRAEGPLAFAEKREAKWTDGQR